MSLDLEDFASEVKQQLLRNISGRLLPGSVQGASSEWTPICAQTLGVTCFSSDILGKARQQRHSSLLPTELPNTHRPCAPGGTEHNLF